MSSAEGTASQPTGKGPPSLRLTRQSVGRIVKGSDVSEITHILEAAERGDPKAADELLALVYPELRKLAAQKMALQAAGHTLQATALVHEAWLRLLGGEPAKFTGRAHFFAAAAEAMRHILIDSARRKKALRHGGHQARVDIDEVEIAVWAEDDELLMVHEVLDKLAAEAPQKAELVKLRYFVGMTFEEAAQTLNISVVTAKRYWAYSRAWLYTEIQRSRPK
jgi:RNA polymerase sigma factor (TIGR02999 family)